MQQDKRIATALPPGDALLAGGLCMCTTAILVSLWSAGIAFATAMAGYAFSRPRIPSFRHGLIAISVFILFLVLTMPLTLWLPDSPPPVGTVHPLMPGIGINLRSLEKACVIALKSYAVYFFFLTYMATVPFPQICSLLHRWGMPPKLLTLMLLVVRHIASIRQEAQSLWTAAVLRGFVPRTSLRSYKTVAYLIGMLFIRCHDTLKRTNDAMKLRGFTGKFPFFPAQVPLDSQKRYAVYAVAVACTALATADRMLP